MRFLDEDLAAAVRAERARLKLSQEEAATRLIASGRYDSLSKQAVSKAENYQSGDGMNSLRVALYEDLTGRTLAGPYWIDEPDEEQ